jgi:hypothetical protein
MQNTTAVYISTTKPARRLVTVDRDMAVSERVALRMPAACCLLLAFRHQKCTAIPSLGRNYPRCCTSSHHLAWDFPTAMNALEIQLAIAWPQMSARLKTIMML